MYLKIFIAQLWYNAGRCKTIQCVSSFLYWGM